MKIRNAKETGIDNNIKLFDVVIADNGSEFKDLYKLEEDEDGNHICKVFYCDPYRSNQKAECEKNHVFFRRIVPKGTSFKDFTQKDVDTIFSHINSYPRASLKNKSPYDLELRVLVSEEMPEYAVNVTPNPFGMYIWPQQGSFTASVQKDISLLTGMVVVGKIIDPDGMEKYFELTDDGANGDTQNGDGVYFGYMPTIKKNELKGFFNILFLG